MKKLITTFWCLMALSMATGQDLMMNTVSSGGDFTTHSQVKLSWNLGESCIQTWNQPGIILTEGFFQNFDLILDYPVVENSKHVRVYPNPTRDVLHIDVPEQDLPGLTLSLFDMQGRLLEKRTSCAASPVLYLTDYQEGMYLLSIYGEEHDMRFIKKIIVSKK
jgi:hypothetical protein